MFKDLKRVVYQVPDVEAARNWYGKLLGKSPYYESSVLAAYEIGSVSLSLVRGRDPLKEDAGRVSVYWAVDNVDEALGRMIDLGASQNMAPVNYPGARMARALDPFGNMVGLAAPLKEDADQTIENDASKTAMNVASFRAMAVRDERPGMQGPDIYAHLFLSDELVNRINDPAVKESDLYKLLRPLYGYFIARTAFFDHVFQQALQDQTPQIVNLGAGYDTRAYRFRDQLSVTKVLELDAPTTQNRKRSILQAKAIPAPPQLSYVAINFKSDDLNRALEKTLFDRNSKSLFICEGVIYYLDAAAVDTLLDAIKRNSIPGSKFCFDYMSAKLPSSSSGEPLQFWIEEARIPAFLSERGFRIVDYVNTEEMEKRYLTLPDGALGEKPAAHMHFILAERVEE
jgi:methyltransferase (TIGR00027 family)